MAKNVTTAGAAAARRPAASKAAAKPAAPSAQQQANIAAVQAFAKKMGVKATIEGADDEPTAEAVATVLANGDGTLYTDGELAQGSSVYNDAELTQPTDDGEYEAEDGRIITVAGGAVESIADGEAEAAAETGTAAITAAVTAAMAPFRQELDELKATFNKTVPPTPRPRAAAGQQTDPKAGGKPKPRAAHHAQL